MDARRFDAIARGVSVSDTRRRVVGAILGVPIIGGLAAAISDEAPDVAEAKKKKKKCKRKPLATICAGQCGPVKNKLTCKKTVDCGPCGCEPNCPCDPACSTPGAPDCANRTCTCESNGNEPCAGGLACCASGCVDLEIDRENCGACGNAVAANELCVDGASVACDVTCSGNPLACGETLQERLSNNTLDRVYVCPGFYEGVFTIDRKITVIGAGQGDNSNVDTILDANGAGVVVELATNASEVTLSQLRVIRGNVAEGIGSGIRANGGGEVRIIDCTITGNTGLEVSGLGVGLEAGALTMIRSTLSDNQVGNDNADSFGGGLYVHTGSKAALVDCVIENNRASVGGGIAFAGYYLNLEGQTRITRNVALAEGGGLAIGPGAGESGVDIQVPVRITNNRAPEGEGGGISDANGGPNSVVNLLGENPSPIVVDNCLENCAGNVGKCAAGGGDCPVKV